MASEYVKKIKLGLDLSQIKEETRNFSNTISRLYGDAVSSFQEKMFGSISNSRQLKTLEKDLSRLKTENQKIIEQRKLIVDSDIYKEYSKDMNRKKFLKTQKDEESKKELAELTEKYKNFDELFSKYKSFGPSEETKQYDELFSYLQYLADLEELQNEISKEALEKRTGIKELSLDSKAQSQQALSNLTKGLTNKLVEWLSNVGESIKDLFSDAINEFKNMASYSLNTSLKINSKARDMALEYGLSDSQNYALSKAMESVGASSMEDLYLMTPAQRDRFAERMGYYTSKYQEMSDKELFQKYEEYQATVEDLKTDLQMDVISFFAENKDVIIWGLETGINILQGVMNILSGIANVLGLNQETKESAISDVVNNYSNKSSSNTNVKIDNNFNGLKANDVQELRKAGDTVNRQMIQHLNQS